MRLPLPSRGWVLFAGFTIFPFVVIGCGVHTVLLGMLRSTKQAFADGREGLDVLVRDWQHMKWFRRSRRPRPPVDKKGFPLARRGILR